jgi:hypothetical protein
MSSFIIVESRVWFPTEAADAKSKRSHGCCHGSSNLIGVPRGIRTPVIAVKERWDIFFKWAMCNGFELTFLNIAEFFVQSVPYIPSIPARVQNSTTVLRQPDN